LDKLGCRDLFVWTLAIYLIGTGLSALAFRGGLVYFSATPVAAGMGIVGGYRLAGDYWPAWCSPS